MKIIFFFYNDSFSMEIVNSKRVLTTVLRIKRPKIPIRLPPLRRIIELWNFPCNDGSSLKSALAKTSGDSIVSKNGASPSGP